MAYEEREARRLVIEAGHRLLEEKLIARTWGNISARLSGEEFLITPSGRAYDSLTEADLVKVRIGDCSYEGSRKPSSEKGIHAAIYRLRGDANFIIHTHQFYASAVSAEGKSIISAPCAAYGLPGTKRLRRNVERSVAAHPESSAFLMARHGALAFAADAEQAFRQIGTLEKKCKELVERRMSGRTPLPEDREGLIGALAGLSIQLPATCGADDFFVRLWLKEKKKELPAYLDDFAQLIGSSAPLLRRGDAGTERWLRRRGGALIEGVGALGIGKNAEDAEAAAMLLSKNCAAALYVRDAAPMGAADSRLQRLVYQKKYSKLKEQ